MSHAAIIIIDSGFNAESLQGANRVLGICDLNDCKTETGAPFLSQAQLSAFANDPGRHGSIVLEQVRALAPDAPLVLIRAINPDEGLIRTGWHNGAQVSPGWTEAYLWAVQLCAAAGLPSVANCSFGGYTHALDGTGWESFQLAKVCGAGKPGHIVVAAAGPGDGRAIHASWLVLPDETVTADATQNGDSKYNFWCDATGCGDWRLDVRLNGNLIHEFRADNIPANFWNGRRQLTFRVPGSGRVQLSLSRIGIGLLQPVRFDCWLNGDGAFVNHVDPVLIAEPAVFPQVIAVGLRKNSYSPRQHEAAQKPDVLLDGTGAISFRTPSVTAHVAKLLSSDPSLDADAVRLLLGKNPVLP
jgi:hypothetical protein